MSSLAICPPQHALCAQDLYIIQERDPCSCTVTYLEVKSVVTPVQEGVVCAYVAQTDGARIYTACFDSLLLHMLRC